MPQPFVTARAAAFDAGGTAEVSITPPGVDWHVQITSVSSSSQTDTTATLTIDGEFHEGSYSGNRDSSDTVYTIPSGSTLTCTWTDGHPGAQARISLRGIQTQVGA